MRRLALVLISCPRSALRQPGGGSVKRSIGRVHAGRKPAPEVLAAIHAATPHRGHGQGLRRPKTEKNGPK